MAQILFRRDTASNWTLVNPTLAEGEPGLETDTGRFKLGDGSTAWADLTYYDPFVLGFRINDGTAATNAAGRLISHKYGLVTTCKLIVDASDASTDLEFRINKNGTSVFLANNTVAAGTTGGTLETFTNLTSSPLQIDPDDLFTIDIITGGSAWQFTVILES